MESELGWMRYYSCNIGCSINSENIYNIIGGSFAAAGKYAAPANWASYFLSWARYARDCRVQRLLSAHGKGTEKAARSQASPLGIHGGSSPELCRNRAADYRFQIRGHGEIEEDAGIPFWRLRAWERAGRWSASGGHCCGPGSSWGGAGGR